MHFTPARAFAVLTAACLSRITANAVNISLSHTYVQASDRPAALAMQQHLHSIALLHVCARVCIYKFCSEAVACACLCSSIWAPVAHASCIAVRMLELRVFLQTNGVLMLVSTAPPKSLSEHCTLTLTHLAVSAPWPHGHSEQQFEMADAHSSLLILFKPTKLLVTHDYCCAVAPSL